MFEGRWLLAVTVSCRCLFIIVNNYKNDMHDPHERERWEGWGGTGGMDLVKGGHVVKCAGPPRMCCAGAAFDDEKCGSESR